MSSKLRGLRVVVATALVSVVLQLGSVVAGTAAQAQSSVVTATTWVNIRSGPGTGYAKLGILQAGQSLPEIGRKGVWSMVNYNGRTAYIHSAYLSTKVAPSQPISGGGASGVRYSVARLNVRTGPSLNAAIVTTVNGGTAFTLSGRTSNGFSEVTFQGNSRWVWSAYLSANSPGGTGLPAVTGKMRLTGTLMIRTSSAANFTSVGKLPIGSIIDVTGVKQNGVVQAIYQGQVRWFDANWVVPVSSNASNPSPAPTPGTIGDRYSKSALSVRASASHSGALLATAPAGTKFQVTGRITDGWAEVIWQGRSAWVPGQYLIATSGSLLTSWSAGLDSLLPSAKGVVNTVKQNFPRISVMYGVRFDSYPDHPSGKSVDIMLPSRSDSDYGWEIAKYMQANAKRLGIRYIIYSQRVWNVELPDRGWRLMADRGSITANHYDHVHVTTY